MFISLKLLLTCCNIVIFASHKMILAHIQTHLEDRSNNLERPISKSWIFIHYIIIIAIGITQLISIYHLEYIIIYLPIHAIGPITISTVMCATSAQLTYSQASTITIVQLSTDVQIIDIIIIFLKSLFIIHWTFFLFLWSVNTPSWALA